LATSMAIAYGHHVVLSWSGGSIARGVQVTFVRTPLGSGSWQKVSR